MASTTTPSSSSSSSTSYLGPWSSSSKLPTDTTPSSTSYRLITSASPSSSTPPSTASPPEEPAKKLQGWKHSAAGSLGGMTGAIVTSPFDVVKTRLQSDLFRTSAGTTSSSKAAAATAAKLADKSRGGLWHFVDTMLLIRRIGVDEGWRALYKGLGPSLVGIIPARAINFYCYPTSKAYLASQFPNAPTEKPGQTAEDSPLVHLGAAVIAGICTATGTNPIWVVKTRLQLSAKKRENATPTPLRTTPSSSPLPRPIATSAAALASSAPTSSAAASTLAAPRSSPFGQAFSMTWDIMSKEGIRGLYRGLSASYLGVSEGVIQWVLYERFKRLANVNSSESTTKSGHSVISYMGSIVGASGGAKAVASLITYPHEVVRTRLRQPTIGGVQKYTGLAQTFKLVVKEEGMAGLYGGLTAHLIRVIPNAACMFLIYEVVAAKLA